MNNVLTPIAAGAAALMLAIAAVPLARGLGAPATPPGITADHWIAMGDSAGFVITDTANDLHDGLRSEPNIVKGYFMIRRTGTWVRISAGPDAGLYKARLAH
jgi:hypothetical protein